MALLTRTQPRLSAPSSQLPGKFLPSGLRSCSGLERRMFRANMFSVLNYVDTAASDFPLIIPGGPLRKTAVMQICIDNSCCYVMNIIHSGIPSTLKSLLENNSSVKVGIGIAGDATKIVNDYDVRIQSLKDLSDLANTKLAGPQKKWSLSYLTKTIIHKRLDKPSSIRLGNWEGLLSEKQLCYAANDAFVSWQLHELLNDMPDLKIEKEYLLEQKRLKRRKKRKRAHCLAKH